MPSRDKHCPQDTRGVFRKAPASGSSLDVTDVRLSRTTCSRRRAGGQRCSAQSRGRGAPRCCPLGGARPPLTESLTQEPSAPGTHTWGSGTGGDRCAWVGRSGGEAASGASGPDRSEGRQARSRPTSAQSRGPRRRGGQRPVWQRAGHQPALEQGRRDMAPSGTLQKAECCPRPPPSWIS